jgi:glycerol-3-phosphate O-acyltransferase
MFLPSCARGTQCPRGWSADSRSSSTTTIWPSCGNSTAVCVAMLGEDRALTLDEVCATVAPLARYLADRGWPVAGGADLTDRATVSQTLHDLVGSGVLTCYSEGPTTVWGIGDDQHLIVAVYRNSAIHVLVMRAIAELALLAIVQTPGATKRTGWEKAWRCANC